MCSCTKIVNFYKTDKVKCIPLLINFKDNFIGIEDDVIHHSQVTGEIIGKRKEKVRENYFKIPVVVHNLFKFQFFFLLKGLRSAIWKTQDINIGGKNPSDINFASIGNQIQFIDTLKYFQQSLGELTNSLAEKEKKNYIQRV